MTMRALKYIDLVIVHCSATRPGQDIGVKDIRRWHKARGWDDVGYHYVITRDGLVENGRHLKVVGAHCRGKNRRSVGICLIGGINERGKPDANFTMTQYLALRALLVELEGTLPTKLKVAGHREFSSKACPSFDVHSLMA